MIEPILFENKILLQTRLSYTGGGARITVPIKWIKAHKRPEWLYVLEEGHFLIIGKLESFKNYDVMVVPKRKEED